MYDGKYFDGIFAYAIGDDIWDIGQNEFSRRLDASNATHSRLFGKQLRCGQDAPNDTGGSFGTVFLDMRADFAKPTQSPLGPTDCLAAHGSAGGLDVFPDHGGQLLFAGELTALGLGQSGLYLSELPLLTSYKVFDGLGGHIRARAIELFGKLVEPVCRVVGEAYGESRHGFDPLGSL
jgi:hypothetical protein